MRIKYDKAFIEKAIVDCTNWSEVCRKIGIKAMSGSQTHLQKRAKFFEIDTTHFLGQAYRKGKTFKKKKAIEHCFKGSKVSSANLRRWLIRDGYKEAKCEMCSNTDWLGEPIQLELDHIDSDHFNNELDNLQILCPNCHAAITKKRKMA